MLGTMLFSMSNGAAKGARRCPWHMALSALCPDHGRREHLLPSRPWLFAYASTELEMRGLEAARGQLATAGRPASSGRRPPGAGGGGRAAATVT
jgi:hypothetical protein